MSRHQAGWAVLICAGLITAYWAVSNDARPAHAMAAHGTDRQTLATVPLDDAMEAIVSLDHVSCELTGYVIDRFSGKFIIQYRYNVASDFPLRVGRVPRFIMVAGKVEFQQFSGNERLASGIIYVSEESSGQIVAYGIPWNSQFRASSITPQRLPFIPLDMGKTRFVDVSSLGG